MSDDKYVRRVVCAAIKFENGVIVVGPRHFDLTMHDQIRARGMSKTPMEHQQGFIDQHGAFMGREEAYNVAANANQPLIRPAFHPGVLFSENLY